MHANDYNQHWNLTTVAKDDINGISIIRSTDDAIKNIFFVLIG